MGKYFHLDGKVFQQQYKDHLRDYKDWAQRAHATEWLLFPENSGVWGREHVMSAHPQLSTEQAAEMVRHILSIRQEPLRLNTRGTVTLSELDLTGITQIAARFLPPV